MNFGIAGKTDKYKITEGLTFLNGLKDVNKLFKGIINFNIKNEKEYKDILAFKLNKKFGSETDFFEWKIDEFNKITEEINNGPTFNFYGFTWQFSIKRYDGNYIPYIRNLDTEDNGSSKSVCEYVIAMRSHDNYNDYYSASQYPNIYFIDDNYKINPKQIISPNTLFNILDRNSGPIVKDNKVVVSVYMAVHEFTNKTYNDYIGFCFNKYIINEESYSDDNITWDIDDWNDLDDESEYIGKKFIGKKKWKIMLIKQKDRIVVKVVDIKGQKWRYASIIVAFKNYKDNTVFCERHTEYPYVSFNTTSREICFNFKKEELFGKNKKTNVSVIENNCVIIHMFIRTYKSKNRQIIINSLIKFKDDEVMRNKENEMEIEYQGYADINLGYWKGFTKKKYTFYFNIYHTSWALDLYPYGSIEKPNNILIYLRNTNNDNYHLIFDYYVCLFRKFRHVKVKHYKNKTVKETTEIDYRDFGCELDCHANKFLDPSGIENIDFIPKYIYNTLPYKYPL